MTLENLIRMNRTMIRTRHRIDAGGC
jgi:hypothetical protein